MGSSNAPHNHANICSLRFPGGDCTGMIFHQSRAGMGNRETLADSLMAGSRLFVSISALVNDVFGMPKEAIKLGAADAVRPLGDIAAAILTHVTRA